MPAGHNWKRMYELEYFQMKGEGYDVSSMPNGLSDDAFFHLDENRAIEGDALWKARYDQLVSLRKNGIRSDFPYQEPDDFDAIMALCDDQPAYTPVTGEDYADRVHGAWAARCVSVMLGKPVEMGFSRQQIKEYLESLNAYPLRDWIPERSEKLNITLREDCVPSCKGHIAYMQSDDDIHYTICSLLLAEKAGEHFTHWDAAQNLLQNITYNWVWTADKHLYYHLVNCDTKEELDEKIAQGLVYKNPWRESMCPQLKADLWGYITPGDPRRGAKMIHRLGSLSASKNGLYGGLFMQGCVSAAMVKQPTVESILAGGLANIPRTSRLHEAVLRVIDWYHASHDWIKVCDKIIEVYGDWYFAGAINNICLIVLSLLEGNLDLEKTMCTAVMCGVDTDCNSGNAGSVVGAALGYKALPQHWIAPLNDDVHSAVADFGFGRISDLAKRTIAVHDKLSAP